MPNDSDTLTAPVTPTAEQRLQQVLARIQERWNVQDKPTIEDLRTIPPCPICGARARIGADGRLEQPCIRWKHYPKSETAPQPKPVAVQRTLAMNDKRHWYDKDD